MLTTSCVITMVTISIKLLPLRGLRGILHGLFFSESLY